MTTSMAGKRAVRRKISSPATSTASITSQAGSDQSIIELPLLPLTLDPGWDEQSLFKFHLVDKLFTWHEDPSSPYSASWISLLLDQTDEAVLPSTSIRALSTSYFAKVHGHSDLMHKGAGYYSQALRALRGQLQDPKSALEDDILIAVICLGIYELVTFTQPSAWLNHYKGLAQLVSCSNILVPCIC